MAPKRRAMTQAPSGFVEVPGTKTVLKQGGAIAATAPDLVPELDPHYHYRREYVEELAYAIECRQNAMLVGDAGVGKSSLVEQLGALTGRPVRRVNLHGESDTTLFVGRDKPTEVNGVRQMVYERGLLAEAMEEGHWLLLDELDAALQPVLFVFQQILEDQGKLILEDGKGTVVRKHPEFRVFATANTVGIASRNRLIYSGTLGRLNEATLDRFGCVIHLQPLPPKVEEKVIKAKVPDLDGDFIQAIVLIANEVRNQLKNEELSCTFSTRRCLQWAQAMTRFTPMRAAKLTVLNKLNQDDYSVLEGVVQRYFGVDDA
jgi:cobaltochelatase CobS